ncbi:MAG: ketoacyl-ACP synthase III [Myxococcaceae bacterium]|jgi:3-oxoacyl-[acyl-carrier-protein] synthase-3|nr:ketoacyl-ACP synthase III [Myxococcaceae bacterium]
MQAYSRIYGSGFVTGERKVTNADMAKVCDTSDEWIRERSGIQERYFVNEGTSTSDLAIGAAKKALDDAGVKAEEIDYIVVATMTPDYYFPGVGSLVQAKLGLTNIPALDIRQQCSGFVYGLQVADALIRAGQAKKLLFIGAEIHTGFMPFSKQGWDLVMGRTDQDIPQSEKDWNSKFRHLVVLFGDAAGAVVMGPTDDPKRGLLGFALHSEGKNVEALYVPSAGFAYRPYFSEEHVKEGRGVPVMDGRTVFKMAVTKMPEAVHEVCAKAGTTVDDLHLLIPHQANLRISEGVQKALKLPDEKVYNNIQRFGNTTAATIPIAYDECKKSGRIKQGDLVCFVGLGAGFHWGAALMRE